jgi:hypothetical protein
MDMVIRAKMILEQPATGGNPVEAQERFSSCDACTKGTHVLCFLNYLGRDIDRVFICIHGIDPFSFTGQRAVPA